MIIVLFGGRSDERHVSVASAQNVVRTLGSPLAWFQAPDGAVHDVAPADLLAHQRPFEADFVPARPAIFPTLEQALDTMPVEDPVVLLALHGTEGEDGTVQRMLEARGIPFTGSDSAASAAAFDKGRAKEIVAAAGVPVAESRLALDGAELARAVAEMSPRHERLVLKPLAGGSSRGLFVLDHGSDPGTVIDQISAIGIPYIVEQFVSGRELTVGVHELEGDAVALPVVEIELDPSRRFDYEGKYLGAGSREICPARIDAATAEKAQALAVAAHRALGCSGYSRTDLIATPEEMVFLELNTLPGLSSRSLVPQELAAAGIAFREFLEGQVELARRR